MASGSLPLQKRLPFLAGVFQVSTKTCLFRPHIVYTENLSTEDMTEYKTTLKNQSQDQKTAGVFRGWWDV
jgi:hypothetical protein